MDSRKIATLRDSRASWVQIAKELGCSARTARRIGSTLAKSLQRSCLEVTQSPRPRTENFGEAKSQFLFLTYRPVGFV